jgi:predicted nuclease of predicted toxin-antitoxin system
MPKFVVDEDTPRSAGKLLHSNGFDVKDVRDFGLRGAKDDEVYRFAQEERATLTTGDLGFGNILHFPLGSHYGIVLIHSLLLMLLGDNCKFTSLQVVWSTCNI